VRIFDEVVFAILLNGDFLPLSILKPRAPLFVADPMLLPILRDDSK